MFNILTNHEQRKIAVVDNDRVKLTVQIKEGENGEQIFIMNPGNRTFVQGKGITRELAEELRFLHCSHLRIAIEQALSSMCKRALFI
mgnify:CR=1 FL=1